MSTVHHISPMPSPAIVLQGNKLFNESQMAAYVIENRQRDEDELTRLRQALVHVANALHVTPQYMLSPGISLYDGNRVTVKIDDWIVDTGKVPPL